MGGLGALFARLLARNASRERLYLENKVFAETVPRGAMVLDAGAGLAPYKGLFSHAVYESADFEKVDKPYASSTYVCDLQSIPVEDCRFDYIIFNQVMEHLSEPILTLNELFRVLKPGGKLIYTAPLFYEEHEQPYDYYRYTQFGVRYLFEKAGFELHTLEWLDGYYATVAYQMNTMAHCLPAKPSDVAPGLGGTVMWPFMLLIRLQMAGLSILFHWLEMRWKITTRGYPKNYVAVVSRPAGTAA